MSRIKNLSPSLYHDTYDAIHTLMDEQMTYCSKHNGYIKVYSENALDMALAYLCVNDIPHSYSIRNIDTFGLGNIKSVVTIQWMDDGMERSCIFFGTMEAAEDEDEV